MSTTHIQPLPNVYGRMAYTELGEGKKRTENIQNGTNRIAAQMGDGDSREEFVRFCSAMKRQNQGRENEGFEVRVSWAPEELRLRGVELNEVRKVDKETGEETVGWSYKAHDPLGKTKRKRRRRASNLADDLTKEGVEAYFEEKQRQAEAQKEDAPAPAPVATVAAEPQPDSPAEASFDVYEVEKSDVAQMAGDLQRAHIDRCRESGEPFMGERYEQLMEAERHPEEQLEKLQAEVDAARREFHASKEARDMLSHPCPNLLAGAWVFAKAGRDAKDPVSRMMADMTAMMLRMLLQQAMEEQRRREREAAERRLYESRRNMWDAEKRLKSAEKVLAHEDERKEQAKRIRLQEREDKAARRAGGRVKYGADADKQYE